MTRPVVGDGWIFWEMDDSGVLARAALPHCRLVLYAFSDGHAAAMDGGQVVSWAWSRSATMGGALDAAEAMGRWIVADLARHVGLTVTNENERRVRR